MTDLKISEAADPDGEIVYAFFKSSIGYIALKTTSGGVQISAVSKVLNDIGLAVIPEGEVGNLSKRMSAKVIDRLSDLPKTEDGRNSIANITLSWMMQMDSEQRMDLLNSICIAYCKYCGDEHPSGRVCQCWNDK